MFIGLAQELITHLFQTANQYYVLCLKKMHPPAVTCGKPLQSCVKLLCGLF